MKRKQTISGLAALAMLILPLPAIATGCNGDDAYSSSVVSVDSGSLDASPMNDATVADGSPLELVDASSADSGVPINDAAVAQCPLGPDASYFDDFPTESDLPSGACSAGAAQCELQAEMYCGCPMVRGPVNVYSCSCNGGSWSCVVIDQGASNCDACPDADMDAGD